MLFKFTDEKSLEPSRRVIKSAMVLLSSAIAVYSHSAISGCKRRKPHPFRNNHLCHGVEKFYRSFSIHFKIVDDRSLLLQDIEVFYNRVNFPGYFSIFGNFSFGYINLSMQFFDSDIQVVLKIITGDAHKEKKETKNRNFATDILFFAGLNDMGAD